MLLHCNEFNGVYFRITKNLKFWREKLLKQKTGIISDTGENIFHQLL